MRAVNEHQGHLRIYDHKQRVLQYDYTLPLSSVTSWALFQKVLVRFLIDVRFLVFTAPSMEMSLQGYSVM